jgi:putative DNA primase/helicase
MNDNLTAAIDAVDLPGMIHEDFPDSGATPGRGGAFKAVWRGDTTPSGSLFRSETGAWLFKDHGLQEGGNAYHYLTVVMSLTPGEAARRIKSVVSVGSGFNPNLNGFTVNQGYSQRTKSCLNRPVSKEVEARHKAAIATAEHLPTTLMGRGFSLSDCRRLGIVADGDDALIAITNPDGQMVNLKRRRNAGKPKYLYELKEHGAPAWCSPNFRNAADVIVIEGELNAMALHLSLPEYGIMGAAGADNHLYLEALIGKTVYVYADDDDGGHKALDRWSKEAHEAGAEAVYQLGGSEKDAADLLAELGTVGVAEAYRGKLELAVRYKPDEDERPPPEDPNKLFSDLKERIKSLPNDPGDALTQSLNTTLWADIAALPNVQKGIILQAIKRQTGIGVTEAKGYVKDAEGGEVSPNDLRNIVLETWQTRGTYIRYVSGWQEWFTYREGVYRKVSEEYIYKIVDEVLEARGHKIREHFLKDVIAKLSRHSNVFLSEVTDVGNTLNLKNGILDVDTLELIGHTPDYISFAQSPASFDPKAECPKFQEFLDMVLPDQQHQMTLQEYSGYSLTPYNHIQIALYLFGPGGRGKGTFVRVLEKLFGDSDQNGLMANLTIQDLVDGSPALVNALNKRLIYISEANRHASLLGFKKITGQDKVFINPKYKSPYEVRLNTKIIISANVYIHTGDDAGNDSIDRRIAILPFVTDKSKLKSDSRLGEEFTTPEELSGVLNWCLAGWMRIKANGDAFTYGGDKEYRKEMLQESNPVIMYLEENYEPCELEDYALRSLNIYKDWRFWAEGDGREDKGHGFSPGNITTFTQRVKNACEVLGWKCQHVKNQGVMVWRGFRKKPGLP